MPTHPSRPDRLFAILHEGERGWVRQGLFERKKGEVFSVDANIPAAAAAARAPLLVLILALTLALPG